MGRSFIVFADDWGRWPSSTQHLFRRIACHDQVCWVNTVGSRSPTFSRADLARGRQKLAGWIGRGSVRVRPGLPGVTVLDPPMVPVHRGRLVHGLNARMVAGAVRAATAAVDDPIVVSAVPEAVGVVERLHAGMRVWYCVDDFGHWPGADLRTVRSQEARLLRCVDLVVATSQARYESLVGRHPRVRQVPHGVDWAAFQEGLGNPPPPLLGLPRPLVGVTGLLDERLDVELVGDVAAAMPDVTFALIGERRLRRGRLDNLRNVHFLDRVAYADLPATIHALDAAIIPYRLTSLADSINPLKLREYLATGIPVVASALPEVVRYAGTVRIAAGAAAWVDGLRAAVGEGRSAARSAAVQDEDWDVRKAEFDAHLLETARAVASGRARA